MANSYTRQSSFSDGDTINSGLFNDEYDQLVLAFSRTVGHTHDGSTGEGGTITKVGPAQDIVISGTSVLPKTSNAIDLGSSTYKFKDAYFAGNITADGSITYNGNVVLGSDAADTVTINGTIQGSSLLFEGATANDHELTLAIPDVTSDVTITLPDSTQTLVGRSTTDTLTNKTLTSPTITGNTTFSDGSYDFDVASHDGTNGLKLGGTLVTASAAELNIMDGVTSTTAELNIMDGVTATASEINILDGVTATTTELNLMDGVTATTTELNKIDGFTGSYTDLNYAKDLKATGVTTTEFDILDGLTATTTELNLMDGVTSTTTELNLLDGVTATTTELNILDGVTATTAELNILDGVTSTATELNLLDGITAIKDEDDMSSDSATSLATQQSIKAYVDATDNSTNVTLTTVTDNYLSISGQAVTAGTVEESLGGTGITSYASGDILYASAANTLSKLAKGSNGQVLKLASGIPSWAVDTNTNTTYTAGDGLDLSTSEEFSLDLKTSGGLKITSTELEVDFGTTSSKACVGNDSRLSNSRKCNNSFDNASTSRTNLGLGTAATKASSDFDAAGDAVAMAIALG